MIDLHLHLDGSLEPEDIIALAQMSDVELPRTDLDGLRDLLSVSPDCTSLGEYLEKFDLPLKVLQTEKTIEQAVYRLVCRLATQGLCYAEIRFAPQLHLKRGLNQKQVIEAAIAGLAMGTAQSGMPAQLILCCMRGDTNHEQNMETVQLASGYIGSGVCGVDLAGNEAAYPTSGFADVFALAKERRVPFVIHAGEAAGADSVRSAVNMGAVRIGHGIRSSEDAGLLRELADKKIALELCYTSNLQTKAVSSSRDYPLERFLNADIVATINTDNMTVSNTNLRREYRLLRDLYSYDAAQLKKIALNSAKSAIVDEAQKQALCDRIEEEFESWLKTK